MSRDGDEGRAESLRRGDDRFDLRLPEAAARLYGTLAAGRPATGRLPTYRFLVTALARLKSDFDSKPRAVIDGLRAEASEKGEPELRTQSVPPERDPLAIIADKLRIRRFITTNFDLDIEQLIAHRGFTRERDQGAAAPGQEPALYETTNPFGATAADTVFRTERAADLINFTVDDATNAFSLIHLHGRAAEGDELVVTERDYLDLYLRRGKEGEVVADALDIGFGSNPLLFVGNGMGEDDILRPLRQFVSERSSSTDRQVVALLPAMNSKARQIEEVIAIYSRYGAHTVHFGFAEIERPPSKQPVTVRWLQLTISMAHGLKPFFTTLAAWLEVKRERRKRRLREKKLQESLRKKVENHEKIDHESINIKLKIKHKKKDEINKSSNFDDQYRNFIASLQSAAAGKNKDETNHTISV
ncbi:SIR2 family protein [Methylobacterium sp. SyP6R]|uniref:SIR2 family protein n=1 Tax=Methylobacterium sp. SyP6R TaxID=2718876 RepID=UPI001F1A6151|nr:SIR2 family protein [Methylobacterium sp. SyP6R]MCF4129928.1 SIR2 family protein [Methylobacterium sp. SyP6R]